MKVKMNLFIVLFAGLLAISTGVTAVEIKIGFVNTIELMAKAPQAEAARKRLEDEFSDRRQELLSIEKDIKSLREKHQRDRDVMREDAIRQLERDILNKERDLKRAERELKEDASIRYNEISMQLRQELLELINKYAKKNGYDLIVTEAAAAFAGPKVEITGQVLNALNTDFKGPSSNSSSAK